jgi:hypothetical protein
MSSPHTNDEDAASMPPVCAAVLASLAGEERGMQAPQIRAELPDDPALATVAYHLKKLERTGAVNRQGRRFKLP